jgi:lysyl-tRNA synthetase class 1
LKGKGAMHSSKGTGLSADQMLKMTPPEVLRFLIMKNQPNKHINFDPGFGLLSLVDEYDQLERMYFGKEETIKGIKDLDVIYELSQPDKIPLTLPVQVPYRHLVTLVQIQKNWKDLKPMLQRSNQLPETISKDDEDRIKQRIHHVLFWLNTYAPASVKFTIKKTLPKLTLTEDQQRFLNAFLQNTDSMNWDAETIHNQIYEIIETLNISPKIAFSTMYQLILGQNKGPRIGYFLSNLDKDFVLKRCMEAVK